MSKKTLVKITMLSTMKKDVIDRVAERNYKSLSEYVRNLVYDDLRDRNPAPKEEWNDVVQVQFPTAVARGRMTNRAQQLRCGNLPEYLRALIRHDLLMCGRIDRIPLPRKAVYWARRIILQERQERRARMKRIDRDNQLANTGAVAIETDTDVEELRKGL